MQEYTAASVKLKMSALVGMSLDSVPNMCTLCPKNKEKTDSY